MDQSPTSRPTLSERTKILVWAAAAGRCTLCNRLVLENEDLGELVPIGELAHNVGWSATSPRGEGDLDAEARKAPENLLLLCRNCHKPVDDGGVIGRYTIEELAKRKVEHEVRVRFLTGIGADRTATILRLVGPIRGVQPALTYGTVLEAATSAGLYPRLLPGAHAAELDLDLRHVTDDGSPASFAMCAREIDTLVKRVHDGVRRDEIDRLAVFAFARIPLLVHLGARLDDKLRVDLFQRQRVDDQNAWRWPETTETPNFDVFLAREGATDEVALVANVSGTISLADLPAETAAATIYEIRPAGPTQPGPTLIASAAGVAAFERTARQFLATVEAKHGRLDAVDLFAAVPLSAAITLGRVLMPHVSPAWHVYDRDSEGRFFLALEVHR